MHCHHHMDLGANDIGILAFMLLALSSSFTHCVLMCGPIASAQYSMRLMQLQSVSERSRVLALLAMPYYIGKAIGYGVLGSATYIFVNELAEFTAVRIVLNVLIILVGLFFTLRALSVLLKSLPLMQHFTYKKTWVGSFVSGCINKAHISPFGVKGLINGIILGFIPCGIVYQGLSMVVLIAHSGLYAFVLMFLFGIMTVPGLLLSSCLSGHIIGKFRSKALYVHSIIMGLSGIYLITLVLYNNLKV